MKIKSYNINLGILLKYIAIMLIYTIFCFIASSLIVLFICIVILYLIKSLTITIPNIASITIYMEGLTYLFSSYWFISILFGLTYLAILHFAIKNSQNEMYKLKEFIYKTNFRYNKNYIEKYGEDVFYILRGGVSYRNSILSIEKIHSIKEIIEEYKDDKDKINQSIAFCIMNNCFQQRFIQIKTIANWVEPMLGEINFRIKGIDILKDLMSEDEKICLDYYLKYSTSSFSKELSKYIKKDLPHMIKKVDN